MKRTRASAPPDRAPSAAPGPIRVGLVLGGGGASGLAFHAGVLWALHHDFGWDPRSADIVVGTSAGSIVGALLRSDVPAEDLAAWATDADPTRSGRRFRTVMDSAGDAVPRPSVPLPTMPGWHTLNALRHPSQIPGAIATLLPHGLLDHTSQVATLERLVATWPSKPLWISAVRVGDGRLRWFGRRPDDVGRIAPADAVAASCAIPVLARPVRIGDHRYLDGGVTSPTHADVLVDADVDLVIVLSPMGHQHGHNPFRALAHRRVRGEIAELERSGLAVQLVSPDDDTIDAMGVNMLDSERAAAVMRQAFLGTAAQIDETVADILRSASADSVA